MPVSSGLVKKIAAVLSERAALKASISGYPSESGCMIVTLYPLTIGTAASAGCEKRVVITSSRFASSPLSRQYALTTEARASTPWDPPPGWTLNTSSPEIDLKSSPVLYMISSMP